MAMTQGTVTIDATGSPSGSGAAREVFDALDVTMDYGTLTGTDLQTAKQRTADLANAVSAIIPHIVANGKAKVTGSDAGLQRIPALPLVENDDCKAPSGTQYLSIE
ncbi:MAG: hypothetical protein U9Q07_04255 [Planctomycetota bacterium]|nr:hypothetical protein [Planctomycetota bacterium]